jgi:hypothetical protein
MFEYFMSLFIFEGQVSLSYEVVYKFGVGVEAVQCGHSRSTALLTVPLLISCLRLEYLNSIPLSTPLSTLHQIIV